ncbi:T9SS type A sorting domain-containing protein [bacterium]|nr:T9SS type A sorting domain-containing protein [bacterium]
MKKILCILFVLMMLFSFGIAQMGDYGDAPDGTFWWSHTATFPSLSASNGPYHSLGSTSTYWLSYPQVTPRSNTTTLEANALVADNDLDDGQPFIFVLLIGIPAPAAVTVPITTNSTHDPTHDIYVNVLIDVDNDLDWDGMPDQNWVVQNKVVNLPADTTLAFSFGGFGFGNDLLLFPVWLRVSLTDAAISVPWQGQNPGGGWGYGETEDWWYAFGRGPTPGGRGGLPGGGGGGGGRRGGGGGGGGGGKSAKLSYPMRVTVPCEQTVCFTVTVKNNGSSPLTNVNVGFSFSGGTPLPSGPNHVPPPAMGGTIPAGGSVTYTFCVTGWPCDGEQSSATYTINLSYDPPAPTGPIITHQFGEMKFVSAENSWSGPAWENYLGANGLTDPIDNEPWECTEGEIMDHDVVAWCGHNPWFGRWITGQPIINPMYMPAGATFFETFRTADSTIYHFQWVTGDMDNGQDSLILSVESDNPLDMTYGGGIFDPLIWKIPIDVLNINNPPTLTSVFPESIYLNVYPPGDAIGFHITSSDQDILEGERDTILIDFYLWDQIGDTHYWADTANIDFYDSGNGSASLFWAPDSGELGLYKLIIICWDYYDEADSTIIFLEVGYSIGIDENKVPYQYQLYPAYPNPFNASTRISYEVPEVGPVKISIYDILGKEIQALVVRKQHPAGRFTLLYDASEIPAGIYWCRMEAAEYHTTQKLLLLK